MSLVIATAIIGSLAASYGLGSVRGHRQGIKQVFSDIKSYGTSHAFGQVLVKGELMDLDTWMTGRHVEYATESKVTPCTLPDAPVENTAYRSDPGNAQHAGLVKIVGTHSYEHPFLNTASRDA